MVRPNSIHIAGLCFRVPTDCARHDRLVRWQSVCLSCLQPRSQLVIASVSDAFRISVRRSCTVWHALSSVNILKKRLAMFVVRRFAVVRRTSTVCSRSGMVAVGTSQNNTFLQCCHKGDIEEVTPCAIICG